jgi:starvation-inducible DNA-binding protein
MATRRSAKTAAPNGSTDNNAPKLIQPNIGIDAAARGRVCDMLNVALSNTVVLYFKTRNYHWNVTGMQFAPLHALFEQQYDQLEEAIDEIAERIRQIGGVPFATLDEYKRAAVLDEQPGVLYPAVQMVRNLLDDHETVIRALRANADTADELGDMGTNDFLIGLMQAHEKMAWFLRAHLEG